MHCATWRDMNGRFLAFGMSLVLFSIRGRVSSKTHEAYRPVQPAQLEDLPLDEALFAYQSNPMAAVLNANDVGGQPGVGAGNDVWPRYAGAGGVAPFLAGAVFYVPFQLFPRGPLYLSVNVDSQQDSWNTAEL